MPLLSILSVVSIQKNETEEGKTYRRSYHYINYQLFVNVAKYKLDQMRKKVKSETKEVCYFVQCAPCCVRVCVCVCVRACVRACMCAYVLAYVCPYVLVCVHV